MPQENQVKKASAVGNDTSMRERPCLACRKPFMTTRTERLCESCRGMAEAASEVRDSGRLPKAPDVEIEPPKPKEIDPAKGLGLDDEFSKPEDL